MIKRLRQALRHPVSQNVIGLYWLQIATFIVPMVTLPYVARVLRPSSFGLVIFSQGFSFVLLVFIDWGFTYHGVRAAAANQMETEQLAEVVRRVRGAQLLLSAMSLLVALVALFVIPKFTAHPVFLLLAWVAAVASGLSPGWFFLGTEKMRLNALVQLCFRVTGAALTFLLVTGPSQAWIVMALFAASSIAGWIASDLMMYRRVPFRPPQLRPAFGEVKRAATLFVGTVAAVLYTSFNVVLLGLFEPTASVAHFGAAERIVRVSLTVLGPIGMAAYPRLAALQAANERERARRLVTIAVAVVTIPALLLAGGLALFAPLIIRIIFGHRYVHASVPILRVLVLIIPVSTVGVVAGSWLMTLHMDRTVVMIVLRAGILNVALGCVLTPLLGPIGMAWSVIAAEATAALGGIIAVKRTNRQEPAAVGIFAGSSG